MAPSACWAAWSTCSARSPSRGRGTARRAKGTTMDLSVVIPIKDEKDNLNRLHESLTAALAPLPISYEILLVDDGSTDGSPALMADIAARDPRLKVIRLRRNYGQSAAMQAGIDFAAGDVIV